MIICVSLGLNVLSWNRLCILPIPSSLYLLNLFTPLFWHVNDVNNKWGDIGILIHLHMV